MEKETYVPEDLVNLTSDAAPEVKIEAPKQNISYKTKLVFIDINRKHETLVSSHPPAITQAGMLQFLLSDRLISFPLSVIFRFETEQLSTVEPVRVIVGEK